MRSLNGLRRSVCGWLRRGTPAYFFWSSATVPSIDSQHVQSALNS
jgi:hypothetical protein